MFCMTDKTKKILVSAVILLLPTGGIILSLYILNEKTGLTRKVWNGMVKIWDKNVKRVRA